MVIVIAPEDDLNNKIEILNQLFQNGLQCYHLRKPAATKKDYVTYLNQIDSQFHKFVVVHNHHELVNDYNLKGIHFPEQKRIDALEQGSGYFKSLNMINKTISSSFHEIETLKHCDFEFDYHLLSPVFSSISKSGYKGRGFNVNGINKCIIGMGGITPENVIACKQLGYQGVGVLGGVWHADDPLEAFGKIKQFFK